MPYFDKLLRSLNNSLTILRNKEDSSKVLITILIATQAKVALEGPSEEEMCSALLSVIDQTLVSHTRDLFEYLNVYWSGLKVITEAPVMTEVVGDVTGVRSQISPSDVSEIKDSENPSAAATAVIITTDTLKSTFIEFLQKENEHLFKLTAILSLIHNTSSKPCALFMARLAGKCIKDIDYATIISVLEVLCVTQEEVFFQLIGQDDLRASFENKENLILVLKATESYLSKRTLLERLGETKLRTIIKTLEDFKEIFDQLKNDYRSALIKNLS